MGNNDICKVISMGNVNFKVHDKTIRELKEVRYIPNLKRNLISLGMLDQIGLSIKVEYGELKILNRSTTIMKGAKKNGVYLLD